ncbi:MAG: hypothetical protein EA403_09145 [Spirochaetaceae bacterium]|nr:MAG: hypothetical protein EA403_09145 [Spirochaetaceae bacterium]
MYLVFHLWSLEWFPFVHSDEVWLASLTRAMLHERSIAATEDFFRLTPRHPHALKTLFHLAQMPFVAISFDHYRVRLLSLLAGFASLAFLAAAGRATEPAGRSRGWSFAIPALLLAVEIQFIYTAHLARQEALLVALLAWVLWQSLRDPHHRLEQPDKDHLRSAAFSGCVVGLAAGIHPNAFLVGLATLALIATEPLPWRRRVGRTAMAAVCMGGAAGTLLALSLWMDPDFLVHYAAFGAEVGVAAPPIQRIFGLPRHLATLFFRRAGTYYLPPVQPQLIVFGASLLAAPFFRAAPVIRRLAAAQLAVIAGMVVVGKYAPPAAVLLWPGGVLLAWAIVGRLLPGARERAMVGCALALMLAVQSGAAMADEHVMQRSGGGYRGYLAAVRASVPDAETVVLANLNAGFAFEYGQLRVWRDLQHLPRGASLLGFLRSEGIELVFYPDELDVIFAERPVWNAVYGNLYPWYGHMQRIVREESEPVTRFAASCYAMRLVRYRCAGPYGVSVYRLLPEGNRSR